jgi:hypothetical protein
MRVFILWHIDPLVDNDLEICNYTKQLLNNDSANKRVSTATIALQQRDGVFYAVGPEIS